MNIDKVVNCYIEIIVNGGILAKMFFRVKRITKSQNGGILEIFGYPHYISLAHVNSVIDLTDSGKTLWVEVSE